MAKGGYRKPSNPAPVSGPGKLSQRTDGGPTQAAKYMRGGKYGDGKAMMEAQQAAPMAAGTPTPAPIATVNPGPAGAKPSLMSLLDAGNPETPLTHGLPYGPGAGPEVSAAPYAAAPDLRNTINRLRLVDDTGDFDLLAEYLDSRGQ